MTTTSTGLEGLRRCLNATLADEVAPEELPARVEEALWAMSRRAGEVVGRELMERGFPVAESVTVRCQFTLPATTGRIMIEWPVVIPPLAAEEVDK